MEEGKSALIGASQEVADLRLLLPTLREITEIKKLTPTLVNTLIEWIEVHNNDKSSGHCYVKVDAYFTAVGMVDIPTECGVGICVFAFIFTIFLSILS